MFRKIAFLCFVTIMVLPVRGNADFREEISADFSSFSAFLVMPVDSEWILDADATKGAVTGDIFTLVKPGTDIVHPVTGEVLGRLDDVEALLELSRIKSGYSYATPLSGKDALKPGKEVHRYKGVSAAFVDKLGGGEPLFQLLETTLPHIDWEVQPPETSPSVEKDGNRLLFLLTSKGLSVTTPSSKILHSYPIEMLSPILPLPQSSGDTTRISEPSPAIVVPSGAASGMPEASIVRSELPSMQGLWRGPRMPGKPVGIEVADFDGDGQMETAVCFEDHIEVGRVDKGSYSTVAKMEISAPMHPLAIDGADLNGDGRWELYVTASRNMRLSSFSLEIKDGLLSLVDDGISWFFRSVPLDGTNRSLLAQRLGDVKDFAGPVFHVERKGNSLVEGEELSLPSVVSIYGSLPFNGKNAERLFASLSSGDLLQTYTQEGEKLWESASSFGGSESSFERPETGMAGDTRYLFLKARIERLPDGPLLLPVNEGSRVTALRQFRNSHLSALAWDGYAFTELWHTAPQGGYLADFRIADIDNDGDKELVTVVLFSRKGYFGKGSNMSSILAYETR